MALSIDPGVVYPDSDGQPMADNTKQFRWIVLLKENLECLFAPDPNVFVAGDLLWYPVEGHPEIRIAPDVLVAMGRPKGDRGSYRQWEEEGVAPQVVFEVLSPGNSLKEMTKKLQFYDRYGVDEYYIYDPYHNELTGLQRLEGSLTVVEDMSTWTSPRLQIQFVWKPEGLEVYYPDGRRFLTPVEMAQQSEQERQRAEQEKQRADQEQRRAERLAEQLRAMGLDPEEL